MRLVRLFFIFLFLVFLSFLGCQKEASTQPLYQFLPKKENISIILDVKNYQTFKKAVINNKITSSAIKKSYSLAFLFKNLKVDFDRVTIAISKITKKQIYETTLISRVHKNMFSDSLSLFQLKLKSASYSNIVETSIGTKKIYGVIIRNVFLASTSKQNLEYILRNNRLKSNDSRLKRLSLKADPESAVTLFVNNKLENMLFDSAFKKRPFQRAYADWLVFDSQIFKNKITFSGIKTYGNNPESLNSMFLGTKPEKSHLLSIIPEDVDEFVLYGAKENSSFFSHIIKASDSIKTKNFQSINNLGVIFYKNYSALLIHSQDSKSLSKILGCNKAEKIMRFKSHSFLTRLSSLIGLYKVKYIYLIDDFIILSYTRNFISKIISYYKSALTFYNSSTYNRISDNLLESSNLLQLKVFKEKKNNTIYAFQASSSEEYIYTSGTIARLKTPNKSKKAIEMLNITLDSDVSIRPQFFYNHRTKGKDIVVQDKDHVLYLMDYNGHIFWKKQLDGQIFSPIRQVDIYKNGKYQMAFSTSHSFIIIDRDGHLVKPFNITFKSRITQPLSVFDYNETKDYRFVLTTKKKVVMYNNKGTLVKGFKFKKTSDLVHAPKHFQANGKDYIVIMESSSNIKILNRKGQIRIKVKTPINFSNNDVFLYKDTFTTIDSSNRLTQIYKNGHIVRTPLHFQRSLFDATSKTLAIVSDEQLTIKSKSIKLKSNQYSFPSIFYINNIIYVAVTDLNDKKIYMFYSNGKLLKGFPIYGSSVIDLADIDNDMILEIVTKTEDDAIAVYKINSSL